MDAFDRRGGENKPARGVDQWYHPYGDTVPALAAVIRRVERSFVTAACDALGIDVGPHPTRPEGKEPSRWERNSSDAWRAYDKALEAWFAKCPIHMAIDRDDTNVTV